MGKDVDAKLRDLTTRLVKSLGENLVSFCLYGPAVRQDTRGAGKEMTTLLIVRDVAPSALRPVEGGIAEWTKRGQPPPLVFSEDGWKASTDVFPIEIEDMREAHRVLHGGDPFEGITTTKADLRQELEREVRGKVLRLRTEFLAAAPRPKAMEDLLLDSAGTFFVLFRAVLRLAGHVPPQTPRTLVQEVAEVAGLDATAFEWVLDKLVGHNMPALKAYDPVGYRYLEQLEKLIGFVDKWKLQGQERQ